MPTLFLFLLLILSWSAVSSVILKRPLCQSRRALPSEFFVSDVTVDSLSSVVSYSCAIVSLVVLLLWKLIGWPKLIFVVDVVASGKMCVFDVIVTVSGCIPGFYDGNTASFLRAWTTTIIIPCSTDFETVGPAVIASIFWPSSSSSLVVLEVVSSAVLWMPK